MRRILRRGARFIRRKFNTEIGTVFSRLVDVVVNDMVKILIKG